jgi:circadian clock protein KaiB
MTDYKLRLYITGSSDLSQRTVASLRQILAERGANYSLTIIDCLADSQQAQEDRILATPTLLVLEPAPVRRISGDLSAPHRLRRILDLPVD